MAEEHKEPFAGAKNKEPVSAFGSAPSDDYKNIKSEVISDKLHRAVAIAKGMNPDLLTQAEYDRKLKRFEEDVKTAYPDLDEKQILSDFEGMTAREERWKQVKEGEPFVGMDPKDYQKNQTGLRPVTMEERLRLDPAQAQAAQEIAAEEKDTKGGFRAGSKESIERAKQSKQWNEAEAKKAEQTTTQQLKEKENARGQTTTGSQTSGIKITNPA